MMHYPPLVENGGDADLACAVDNLAVTPENQAVLTQTTKGSGIVRISSVFHAAKQHQECALIPFVCGGYETFEHSIDILLGMQDAGADMIELGVPCDNPFADGPTIRNSHERAIASGTNGVHDVLTIVRAARAKGMNTPIILMGYYDSFEKEYDLDLRQMCREAAEAGADGFLAVGVHKGKQELDFNNHCHEFGLSNIPLVLPDFSDDRIKDVVDMASTWIYVLSSGGKTGARKALPGGLDGRIGRVRALTDLPLAVGFGISNPDMVAGVGRLCDGAVVGSYLTDCMNKRDNRDEKTREVHDQVVNLKTGARQEGGVKYPAERYSQVPVLIADEEKTRSLLARTRWKKAFNAVRFVSRL